MLERGRITSRQFVWLLVVSIVPTLILFIPNIIVTDAGRDAWLAAALSPALATVLLWVPARLAGAFPDQTVAGYSRVLLGRAGGGVLGLSLAAGFVYTTAIVLRQLSEITITIFFESTPLQVLAGLLLMPAAWAVRGGIEVVARVNDALLVTFFLPIIALVFIALRDLEGTNFLPLLAGGPAPVFTAVYHSVIFFAGPALVFLMAFPAQQRAASGYRSLVLTSAVLSLVFVTVIGLIVAMIGPWAAERRFPALEVVRYLRLTEGAVERLDALLLFLWLANGFVQISLFYYGAVVAAAEALGLRAFQPLTLPMGSVILLTSIKAFPDTSFIQELLTRQLPPLYLMVEIGLPAMLLLVAWARGRLRHGR